MENMLQIKSSWNYVPGGQSVADYHPADILYKEHSNAELVDRGTRSANWVTKEGPDGSLEELYWIDSICILSRLVKDEWVTVRTFSREGVIKKCLWCSFEEKGKMVEWLGIVEEKHGTFISPSGSIHTVRFPFPVDKVFAFQPTVGIILSTNFESASDMMKRISVWKLSTYIIYV